MRIDSGAADGRQVHQDLRLSTGEAASRVRRSHRPAGAPHPPAPIGCIFGSILAHRRLFIRTIAARQPVTRDRPVRRARPSIGDNRRESPIVNRASEGCRRTEAPPLRRAKPIPISATRPSSAGASGDRGSTPLRPAAPESRLAPRHRRPAPRQRSRRTRLSLRGRDPWGDWRPRRDGSTLARFGPGPPKLIESRWPRAITPKRAKNMQDAALGEGSVMNARASGPPRVIGHQVQQTDTGFRVPRLSQPLLVAGSHGFGRAECGRT